MRKIISRQNPLFRRLRSLAAERGAAAQESAWIEGYRLCMDAFASGMAIEMLVVSETLAAEKRQAAQTAAPTGIDTVVLPDLLFRQIATTVQSQGIACVIPRPHPAPLPHNTGGSRFLVLEHVQDPGNVGTMMRTAEAMGFDGAILLPGTAEPFGAKALRSAMGSVFRLPLYTASDMAEAAAWLHRRGCTIYAGHLDGEPLSRAGLSPPGAIVIGNEGAGLTPLATRISDHLIRIPMQGQAESLNAASAAAILCYSIGTFDDETKEGIS